MTEQLIQVYNMFAYFIGNIVIAAIVLNYIIAKLSK